MKGGRKYASTAADDEENEDDWAHSTTNFWWEWASTLKVCDEQKKFYNTIQIKSIELTKNIKHVF